MVGASAAAAMQSEETPMRGSTAAQIHIEIIETVIRLYVSLGQSLDHCLNEIGTGMVEEHELQAHLSASRAQISDILAGNHAVKRKFEEECKRLLSLTSACFSNGTQYSAAMKQAKMERDALRQKTAALADLLDLLQSQNGGPRQ
jgi:hypothetical protein